MAEPYWNGGRSRKIRKRLVVEGNLILQTAAAFGNGDADEVVDLPLLADPLEGRPFLTGTSIAGALRAYLNSWEQGYRKPPKLGGACGRLFGAGRADDNGLQSPLIVEDSIAELCGVEFRDGVRLDPESRTAADDALFNRLLWPAGTSFPLRFELLIGTDDNEATLKTVLATALQGFQRSEIGLGSRRERGCGRTKVEGWRVKEYSLTDPKQLLDWLENGAKPLRGTLTGSIENALSAGLLPDKRRSFTLKARLRINGSLLSAGMERAAGPDKVQLTARRAGGGEPEPLLSGTNLAGALRMRALKIARTLGENTKAQHLVNGIFGPEAGEKKLHASRLRVAESAIEKATTNLVQARVSIDRFTGGALDSALFNAQPVFGGELAIELLLRNPEPGQIGLLLLLLKDLWTGDLAVGGEISVGRGRLEGQRAELVLCGAEPKHWIIQAQEPGKLKVEGAPQQLLEDYVSQQLKDYFASDSIPEAS